nr:hypothetical protein [uncultured bacterium]
MPQELEYDLPVRQRNRASGAGFAVLVILCFLALLLTPGASAQINGMPASVTSPGFGGRQVNGVAPSVTSLGPRGYTPAFPVCCFRGTTVGSPRFVVNPNPNVNFHHHHRPNNSGLAWGYAVPYYGYYGSEEEGGDNPPADEEYNGGPTIFDRRGPGTTPRPAADTSAREDSMQSAPVSDSVPASEAAPAPDQPQTVLVFKDGRQMEVANYAIVGSTLYDLTGGRRQKIALAELDLTATAKQNDDRGIDFQLPASAEAN